VDAEVLETIMAVAEAAVALTAIEAEVEVVVEV
jgi:hypothetical protein